MRTVNSAGALQEIGKLEDMLAEMRAVPRKVAIVVAPKLTALLRRQFRQGMDPYGRQWARLKPSTLRKHGPPPLTHTRTLGDGTKAEPYRAHYAGVRLKLGASYGFFHQIGFKVGRTKVPARRILPQFGIPAEWRAILRNATRDTMTATTRRAR